MSNLCSILFVLHCYYDGLTWTRCVHSMCIGVGGGRGGGGRVFGARVDVNINLIMHHKPYLVPKFPKSPHRATPSPLVSNTLSLTTLQQKRFPPPPPPTTKLYIPLVFGARVDVNLNLIVHHKPYLVPEFPKSPHRGRGYPLTPSPLVSNTLLSNINGPPPLALQTYTLGRLGGLELIQT